MSHSSHVETDWLSDAEQAFWRRWITSTARIAQAIEHDLKKSTGLTFGDYEVLVELSEAPERRLRMSELAERTVHSASRLSMRVDRLVKLEMVERERCPEDRRGFFAVLTDHGFARLESAAPGHVASVRRHLVDRFEPEDIRAMSALLSRLSSDLEPSDAEASDAEASDAGASDAGASDAET